MFCFEVRSVLTLFWRAGSVLILKSLGGALLGIDRRNNYCKRPAKWTMRDARPVFKSANCRRDSIRYAESVCRLDTYRLGSLETLVVYA